MPGDRRASITGDVCAKGIRYRLTAGPPGGELGNCCTAAATCSYQHGFAAGSATAFMLQTCGPSASCSGPSAPASSPKARRCAAGKCNCQLLPCCAQAHANSSVGRQLLARHSSSLKSTTIGKHPLAQRLKQHSAHRAEGSLALQCINGQSHL